MAVIVVEKSKEVVRRIRDRFRSRVLEWEHSIIATLWGLIVLTNPSVFTGPGFVAFWGPVDGKSAIWGYLVFTVGMVRILALVVNGYMARPTAIVRVVSAVLGILLFGALSLGFLFSWRFSTPLALYPVLGFFGLFSFYWALFDVAVPDEHDD